MNQGAGGVELEMPVVIGNPTEQLERAELRKAID